MKKLINIIADHLDIGHGPIGCWIGIITIVGFQLLCLPVITRIADKGFIGFCFILFVAVTNGLFILAEIEITRRAKAEKRSE